MAKYKLDIPPEVFAMAIQGAEQVAAAITSGTLPGYPEFVNRLMKEMPTAADELHHACTGIAGEGGELLDLSKKVWAYGKPLDLASVIEELGDMRFYYQALLNMLGLTDEEIVAQNMIKLRKRYASGTYSDAQAIARADKVPGADRRFMGQPLPDAAGPAREMNKPFVVPKEGEGIYETKCVSFGKPEEECAERFVALRDALDKAKQAGAINPAEAARQVAQAVEAAGGPEVDHDSFDAAAKELGKTPCRCDGAACEEPGLGANEFCQRKAAEDPCNRTAADCAPRFPQG